MIDVIADTATFIMAMGEDQEADHHQALLDIQSANYYEQGNLGATLTALEIGLSHMQDVVYKEELNDRKDN